MKKCLLKVYLLNLYIAYIDAWKNELETIKQFTVKT